MCVPTFACACAHKHTHTHTHRHTHTAKHTHAHTHTHTHTDTHTHTHTQPNTHTHTHTRRRVLLHTGRGKLLFILLHESVMFPRRSVSRCLLSFPAFLHAVVVWQHQSPAGGRVSAGAVTTCRLPTYRHGRSQQNYSSLSPCVSLRGL